MREFFSFYRTRSFALKRQWAESPGAMEQKLQHLCFQSALPMEQERLRHGQALARSKTERLKARSGLKSFFESHAKLLCSSPVFSRRKARSFFQKLRH